jgi:hypothetical protein
MFPAYFMREQDHGKTVPSRELHLIVDNYAMVAGFFTSPRRSDFRDLSEPLSPCSMMAPMGSEISRCCEYFPRADDVSFGGLLYAGLQSYREGL